MKTQIIPHILGKNIEVYDDLPIGTKLKAKKNLVQLRLTSGGYMEFDRIFKDKIYEVNYICDWGWKGKIPCVNDEGNCVCWAYTNLFDVI
jgi:hypothetical protein